MRDLPSFPISRLLNNREDVIREYLPSLHFLKVGKLDPAIFLDDECLSVLIVEFFPSGSRSGPLPSSGADLRNLLERFLTALIFLATRDSSPFRESLLFPPASVFRSGLDPCSRNLNFPCCWKAWRLT